MNSKTLDTRQHILDVGYQLVAKKGFTGMGLAELLKNADVPKGSFYHYFQSKEQFGEALLEDYFARYVEKIDALFCHSDGNFYQRIMRYWHYWAEHNSTRCDQGQCLVVKLAGEVTDLSEPMRLVFLKGTNKIIAMLADCIEHGIKAGDISPLDSNVMAERLYDLWLGASLLNKIRQDDSSLQLALQTTEQWLNGN